MGGANIPPPIDDLGPPIVIDPGTLPRIDTPLPGPIGLDAKGDTARDKAAAVAAKTVNFARDNIGKSVGNGECFDFVDQALRNAGARSAADFGTITPDADYVWGTSIALADVRPGDVIQFRNYRYDRTIETSTAIDTDFQERPHHTSIVERIDSDGALTVLEQNVPDGSPVQRTQLFFSKVDTNAAGKKTRITVKGIVRFYRPQPR